MNKFTQNYVGTCAFRKVEERDFSLPVDRESTRDVTEKMAQTKWRRLRILNGFYYVKMRSLRNNNYGFDIPDMYTKRLCDQKNLHFVGLHAL